MLVGPMPFSLPLFLLVLLNGKSGNAQRMYFYFLKISHFKKALFRFILSYFGYCIFHIADIDLCTGVDDNCATNAPWCQFLTECKSNCQTIDTVTYACPDKCRKCSDIKGKVMQKETSMPGL